MRRKELEWKNNEEIAAFLSERKTGTLSFQDEGRLFSFPMNYFFEDGSFYFHGSASAFKMAAVRRGVPAVFCVYEELALITSGWLGKDPCSASQFYRSVIANGILSEITGMEVPELLARMMALYEPGTQHHWDKVPQAEFRATALIKLSVSTLSAKQKIGQHLDAENRALLCRHLSERGLPGDLKLLTLLG